MKKGSKPVSTGKKQGDRTEGGQFAPGVSGNPNGRPPGSRNKLTEEFIEALAADFAEHGRDVIRRVCVEDPGAYLRVIASLVPKQAAFAVGGGPLEDLSDEEVNERIRVLSRQCGFPDPFKSEGSA